MLTYPNISPIALSLGPVKIHWYGIAYLLTFAIAYLLIPVFFKEKKIPSSKDLIADLLLASLLGVVIGGRLGYILFYQLPFYLKNPLNMLKIWEGGLSFHGGMLGVIIGLYFFAKKRAKPAISFYQLTDAIIPIVPIGIFLVRIGNFINAELYGRITESPICMRFPTNPSNCRYPSQLIEAASEGALLFIIIFLIRNKIKTPGILSWIFILGYAGLRFLAEFFREPDIQIGYLWGNLTQGQYLSLIMIAAGAIGIYFTKKKR